MDFIHRLALRHNELKRRIHAFRYPLSPPALAVARVVYFSIPVALGYGLLQWTLERRDANLGPRGEKLLEARARWRAEEPQGRR